MRGSWEEGWKGKRVGKGSFWGVEIGGGGGM